MSTLTSVTRKALDLACPDLAALEATGGDQSWEPVLHVDGSAELPCHTVAADLWFADLPADIESAKALCAPCPLRTACLSGALERREPWGVWGGELVLAGVVVPRKRPRGRPRKDRLAA